MAGKQTPKKDIILSNAKTLFSEKGYDRTSMDEIAVATGVPKSLIYYHFKSKEALLNAIINRFYEDYEQILISNETEEKYDQDPLEAYFNFLYSNRDFLRIIVAESLKSGRCNLPIFKAIDILLKFESSITGDESLLDYNQSHYRWVNEFFTSTTPYVIFACCVDDWSRHFGIDIESIKNDFFTAYRQTHGVYHANLKNQVRDE
jgi:AcrR family transcriptional regulator